MNYLIEDNDAWAQLSGAECFADGSAPRFCEKDDTFVAGYAGAYVSVSGMDNGVRVGVDAFSEDCNDNAAWTIEFVGKSKRFGIRWAETMLCRDRFQPEELVEVRGMRREQCY